MKSSSEAETDKPVNLKKRRVTAIESSSESENQQSSSESETDSSKTVSVNHIKMTLTQINRLLMSTLLLSSRQAQTRHRYESFFFQYFKLFQSESD